jgi:hypothetical protein
VKAVAERTKAAGSRVLRDQWCPVKVDNACRTAVLDKRGELRAGVTEMLEKENDVKIAKVSWPTSAYQECGSASVRQLSNQSHGHLH